MQRRGGVGFVVLVEVERVTAAGCEHGHVAQWEAGCGSWAAPIGPHRHRFSRCHLGVQKCPGRQVEGAGDRLKVQQATSRQAGIFPWELESELLGEACYLEWSDIVGWVTRWTSIHTYMYFTYSLFFLLKWYSAWHQSLELHNWECNGLRVIVGSWWYFRRAY